MFPRVVTDPAILGGKPCIRGTRISVEHLLELAASGADRAAILARYPHLAAEDIEQAFAFAAANLRNEIIITAKVAG